MTRPAVLIFFCAISIVLSVTANAQTLMTKWERVAIDSHVVPHKVAFFDSLLGYLVALSDAEHFEDSTQTRLYRTIDGGKSWEKLKRPTGLYPTPTFISIPTSHDLFFLGGYGQKNPQVLHSADSGKSWAVKLGQLAKPPAFYRMWTPNIGYRHVIGQGRKWDQNWVTYDSGKTYGYRAYDLLFAEYLSNDSILPSIEWLDSLRGMYVLKSPTNRVLPILRTLDGGRTWDSLSLPNERLAYQTVNIKVEPTSSKIWLRIFDSVESLFYTSDFGDSWQAYNNYAYQLIQVHPVEDGLWGNLMRSKGGFLNGNTNDIIMYSTDNGASWMLDSISLKGQRIGASYFKNENNGWLFISEDSTLYSYRLIEKTISTSSVRMKSEPTPAVVYRLGHIAITGFGNPAKLLRVNDVLGREYHPRVDREGEALVIRTSDLPPSGYFAQVELDGKVVSLSFVVHR